MLSAVRLGMRGQAGQGLIIIVSLQSASDFSSDLVAQAGGKVGADLLEPGRRRAVGGVEKMGQFP